MVIGVGECPGYDSVEPEFFGWHGALAGGVFGSRRDPQRRFCGDVIYEELEEPPKPLCLPTTLCQLPGLAHARGDLSTSCVSTVPDHRWRVKPFMEMGEMGMGQLDSIRR